MIDKQALDEIDEQDNYYERHESPEIVAAFLHFIETAPVIPSSYNIYTEEERDLF